MTNDEIRQKLLEEGMRQLLTKNVKKAEEIRDALIAFDKINQIKLAIVRLSMLEDKDFDYSLVKAYNSIYSQMKEIIGND